MDSSAKITRQLLAKSAELGFDKAVVAEPHHAHEEQEKLELWLAEGRHGDMAWLAREPRRRCDPAQALPGCASLIIVCKKYLTTDHNGTTKPSTCGRVSRYARATDYHRVLDKPLKKLARWLNQAGGDGTRSKPYVDHGPVLERYWAERGGLGFRGKHTLLIDPDEGSYFFLGVVLTTLKLEPTPPPAKMPGCGACTRCIDACPTGAITEPWKLDARRCLSYLTIEHPGEVPEEFWPHYEGWVFGCDICQDVCPYNQKRATPRADEPFGPEIVPGEWSLVEMLRMEEAEFAERFRRSPLRRTGRDGLARNAAIVASERGGAEEREALLEILRDEKRPDWLHVTAARAVEKRRLKEKQGE
ncbi:MAG: tRNA epoxyqueuosine(34) reductase QueG [Sumerlaeia bacterium]